MTKPYHGTSKRVNNYSCVSSKFVVFCALMKARSHDRSSENAQISMSIPKGLLQEVDALAKKDDRSRSRWIVRELIKAVERANTNTQMEAQRSRPVENPAGARNNQALEKITLRDAAPGLNEPAAVYTTPKKKGGAA
jgi:hypothetical protein